MLFRSVDLLLSSPFQRALLRVDPRFSSPPLSFFLSGGTAGRRGDGLGGRLSLYILFSYLAIVLVCLLFGFVADARLVLSSLAGLRRPPTPEPGYSFPVPDPWWISSRERAGQGRFNKVRRFAGRMAPALLGRIWRCLLVFFFVVVLQWLEPQATGREEIGRAHV